MSTPLPDHPIPERDTAGDVQAALAAGFLGTVATMLAFVGLGWIVSLGTDVEGLVTAIAAIAPIGMLMAFSTCRRGTLPVLVGCIAGGAVCTMVFQAQTGLLVGPLGAISWAAAAMVAGFSALLPMPGYVVGRVLDWAMTDDDGAPPRSRGWWRFGAMVLSWAIAVGVAVANG